MHYVLNKWRIKNLFVLPTITKLLLNKKNNKLKLCVISKILNTILQFKFTKLYLIKLYNLK